ncbi:unnamed protein product, partial [Closterium sp. NIES-54]
MLRTFLNVHPTHKPILSLLILYPRPHPAITILSARPPSQPSSSTLSITPSGTTISSLPQAGGDSAFLCLAGGGGTDLHLAGGDSELDAEVRIAAWTVGGGVEQLDVAMRASALRRASSWNVGDLRTWWSLSSGGTPSVGGEAGRGWASGCPVAVFELFDRLMTLSSPLIPLITNLPSPAPCRAMRWRLLETCSSPFLRSCTQK